MGTGSDELGLLPAVGAGAAAGEGSDVVGAVGAAIGNAAAVRAAEGLHAFPGPDGDDILGSSRRVHGIRTGSGVTCGEDDDHLLVAGSRIRRAGRLGVAHEVIVRLRSTRVGVAAGVAPTVAADAGVVVVSRRLQRGVVGRGKVTRVEDHGRADLHKRADAQTVVISGSVHEWKTGQIRVPANDVGVEIAVTVAALERAARVRRTDEPVVGHAAGAGTRSRDIQTEVIRRSGAVVNAAVRDINDKVRGCELRLRKTLRGQPGEIARRTGVIAREIAADDLVLSLVPMPRRVPWLDRDHVGLRCDQWQQVRWNLDNDVFVVRDWIRVQDRGRLDVLDERERAVVARRIQHELNREQTVACGGQCGLVDHAGRLRVDLVLIQVGRRPLNVCGCRGEHVQHGERLCIPVDKVGVAGDVRDDLDAGVGQLIEPGRLNRPGELHELHCLAGELAARHLQRPGHRLRRVDRPDVQENEILLGHYRSGVHSGDRRLRHFEHDKAFVFGDQTVATAQALGRECGAFDADFDRPWSAELVRSSQPGCQLLPRRRFGRLRGTSRSPRDILGQRARLSAWYEGQHAEDDTDHARHAGTHAHIAGAHPSPRAHRSSPFRSLPFGQTWNGSGPHVGGFFEEFTGLPYPL